TASMIKCISLITQLHLPSNLGELYNRAEKHAKQVISKIGDKSNSSSSSCYFILGNGQLHAIAMYGSLKFNEVFGVRAMAYPTEEFCHSPLFSIQDTDQAIVLGDDDDDDNDNNNNNNSSRELSKRLNEEGFSSVHVGFKNKGIELLLSASFFIQLLLLKLAQKYGLTSCHFLSNKKLLRVSSDFIYP
ncbi:MAG: hypothetical protein ACJ70M_06665, partial [Nitrososphaera sp.]